MEPSPKSHAGSPAQRPSPFSSLSRRIAAAAGACILVLTVLYEARAYRDAVARAEHDSRNLAQALAKYTASVLGQADMLIGMVTDDLSDPTIDAASVVAGTARRGHHRATAGAGLEDIYVYEPAGALRSSSYATLRYERDAALRDFMAFHRGTARDVLFVGRAYRAEHSSDWVVPVSRRLSDSGGDFAGVVVAAVRVSTLTDHFGEFELGPGALIAVVSDTGHLLARLPHVESAIGMDLRGTPALAMMADKPAGTFSQPSPVDGIDRIYSYTTVSGYPLKLVVGISRQHALTEWVTSAIRDVLGVIALLAGLGYGLLRHRRLMRDYEAASEDVQRANRRLADLETAVNQHAVVAVTDVQGTIIHANHHFVELSGYPLSMLIGSNHRLLKSTEHDDRFWKEMWRTVANAGVWHGQVCNRARDGHHYWVATTIVPFLDERGKPYQYIALRTDITAQKTAEARMLDANQRLSELASSDTLTGLANRRRLDVVLAEELSRASRSGAYVALLMVDVDHFKRYNDLYGHAQGDECLKAVAEQIRAAVRRPGDLAVRWGGEEFVLLLPGSGLQAAEMVAARLVESIRSLSLEHAGSEFRRVTVSVGVSAVCPQPGDASGQALLRMADQRLYKAKAAGRNCACANDSRGGATIRDPA